MGALCEEINHEFCKRIIIPSKYELVFVEEFFKTADIC